MADRRPPIRDEHLATVLNAARAAKARVKVDLRAGTAEIDFGEDSGRVQEAARLEQEMEAAMNGGDHG